jgi:Tol biopolymer transport system component
MSFRDGYCSVFVMNVDGTDPVNLTPKTAGDAASTWCGHAPAWSPTGQRIFFMSFRPSTSGQGRVQADLRHGRRRVGSPG